MLDWTAGLRTMDIRPGPAESGPRRVGSAGGTVNLGNLADGLVEPAWTGAIHRPRLPAPVCLLRHGSARDVYRRDVGLRIVCGRALERLRPLRNVRRAYAFI